MDNLTSNSNTEMTSSIFHNHLKKYLVNSWFWSRKMFAPWFMACAKRSIRFLRWRMMSSKIHIFLSVCCSNGSRSLSGRTSKSLYIFNGENCNKTSVPKPETCCVCAGCTCYQEIKRAERAGCLRFFLPFILPNIILIARIVRKHPYWSHYRRLLSFILFVWRFLGEYPSEQKQNRSYFRNQIFLSLKLYHVREAIREIIPQETKNGF